MSETPAADVTQVLNRLTSGDAQASRQLLPLVYEELRRLARYRMSAESPGHTLQPTALVHEAWMRLVTPGDQSWQNRAHFFAAAAESMRRILVDHARRKQSLKRGGGVPREELDEASIVLAAPAEELLAVNDALERLEAEDPQAAQLVKLRYFVGLTMEETATSMNLSTRSAERIWTYARTWLSREIRA